MGNLKMVDLQLLKILGINCFVFVGFCHSLMSAVNKGVSLLIFTKL